MADDPSPAQQKCGVSSWAMWNTSCTLAVCATKCDAMLTSSSYTAGTTKAMLPTASCRVCKSCAYCGSTQWMYRLRTTSLLAAGAGATRRNRPNLQTGDLVYCRVLTASRDLEPTLSCVDASGKVMMETLIPATIAARQTSLVEAIHDNSIVPCTIGTVLVLVGQVAS